MKQTFVCALAAVVGLAGGDVALACGSGKVAFSDTFENLNSTLWSDPDKSVSVKDGKLLIAQTDGNFHAALADRMFREIDYCAEVIMTEGDDLAASYGGLTFWMRSADDFYTLQITLDGYADVYRYNGEWISIIEDRSFDSITQGIGAKNELRVVTRTGTATFYINGEKFDSITEKRPPGTSRVGLVVDAPSGGRATFSFDNVAVRALTD